MEYYNSQDINDDTVLNKVITFIIWNLYCVFKWLSYKVIYYTLIFLRFNSKIGSERH